MFLLTPSLAQLPWLDHPREGEDARRLAGQAHVLPRNCDAAGEYEADHTGRKLSLPHRQLRTLRQIESGISQSEPGLALMMSAFAQLAEGEGMPDHERCPSANVRSRAAFVRAALMVAVLMARVAAVCLRGARATGRVLCGAARGWPAAGRRSSMWGASWYD